MKKLKNIILIFLASILVLGCNEEKFLDEKPITTISTKSFYKTSEQFEQSVNAAYQELQDLTSLAYWMLHGMRSDVSTYQQNEQNQGDIPWRDIDLFDVKATNTVIWSVWQNLYQGIEKCNTTLYYIEDEEVDKKDRYIAEVKFLRAFYYFNLVQFFGDVPLILKIIESRNEAFEKNKRIPKNEVYAQIISDLNDAKEILPKNYSGVDLGRATEGAARTLLAKVLMWNGRYGDAITELETVYNSGQYALLNDYSSVFDINNENNEEIIFSVQYIEGPYNLGSMYMYRFSPWNAQTTYLPFMQQNGSTAFNMPTQDLIESFETGDERKSLIDTSWIDHENWIYHDSIVPFQKKYWDPGHSVRFVTGSNFNIFRYPHVLLMLAECYMREGGGDPVPLVNLVRSRAGLPELSNVTLDDIIKERKVEFYCEGDRWDVLIRTGKAKEVMAAHAIHERKRTYIYEYAFQHIKLLYPIPDDAITLDPTLEQNSEYLETY
jgi:starch-binding outer membrane protein, SusD/RagB family